MAATALGTATIEEFLRWERQQEFRYEFDGWVPLPMAEDNLGHNTIIHNIYRILHDHLGCRGCQVFGISVKVRTDTSIRYPDVVLTCSPTRGQDDIVPSPVLIAEVLSDITERFDRRAKFADYRQIPTLRHYMLVSQTEARVEVFSRQGDVWVMCEAVGLDASVMLEGLDMTMPISAVYLDTEIAAA